MPSKPKILVVDDEVGMREFLGAYFRAYDLPVVTAGCAAEALEQWDANRGQFRAVVTDIVMPGMNGKLLADCLRAKKPGLQVIFMSGYLPSEIAEEELDGTFFKKPFNPSDLLSALGEAP